MDSLRSAAAYIWNTPILRVPIGLTAICLLAHRNSYLFEPVITHVRNKHGAAAANRMAYTMFGICCILASSDIIIAAAETYNARIK